MVQPTGRSLHSQEMIVDYKSIKNKVNKTKQHKGKEVLKHGDKHKEISEEKSTKLKSAGHTGKIKKSKPEHAESTRKVTFGDRPDKPTLTVLLANKPLGSEANIVKHNSNLKVNHNEINALKKELNNLESNFNVNLRDWNVVKTDLHNIRKNITAKRNEISETTDETTRTKLENEKAELDKEASSLVAFTKDLNEERALIRKGIHNVAKQINSKNDLLVNDIFKEPLASLPFLEGLSSDEAKEFANTLDANLDVPKKQNLKDYIESFKNSKNSDFGKAFLAKVYSRP